jgi:sugar lactone lactonase YvrE
MDSAGNLYVAERLAVRKISPSNLITLVAGTGVQGYDGDHGLATRALLNRPAGIALDGNGNLYIADSGNHVVRQVTTDGIITTIAGTGVAGSAGDGGPAQNAQLNIPVAVAVDGVGNIYVAEQAGARVRRIGPDGTIVTVAGTGVLGVSGDNGPATAARLNAPHGLAFDAKGNLLIAEGAAIVMIRPDGTIARLAGNGPGGYSGDGGPATAAAVNWIWSVAVGPDGSVYGADPRDSVVRKITPDGRINTFAGNGVNGYTGDGGPATNASLRAPSSVVVDAAGNVYIADSDGNSIRMVTPDGMITTLAGKAPPQ